MLLLSTLNQLFSQEADNISLFSSPVDYSIRLSGSFAELRSNHFHSGIDIKSSKGIVGDTLRAAAKGHVSRIKFEYGGYGRALYIDHPLGYTTVYAHMNKFTDELNAYIYELQKQSNSYALDVYLPDSLFTFDQGEFIGIMGNSGRSYGPHLHFEIRKTDTEKPINPYLMGIGPSDTKAPTLVGAYIHLIDKGFNIIKRTPLPLSNKTIDIPAWRAGISISAFDKMNNAANKNGLYSITLTVDDIPYFEYKVDSFSFDETRQINASLDYDFLKSGGGKYFNCYRLPGEDLSMIKKSAGESNTGIIKLYKDKARKLTLSLSDYYGNVSKYSWKLRRATDIKAIASKPYKQLLYYDSLNVISHSGFKVVFPYGSLYKDLKANFSSTQKNSYREISILHDKIPLKSYIHLSINSTVSDSTRTKLCIYHTDSQTSYGGYFAEGAIQARVDRLGNYQLIKDISPPTISFLSIKNKKLKFTLKDNLKVRGSAKEIRYRCSLNGGWILGDYSLKNKVLTIDLSKYNYRKGDVIEIFAEDDRGNKCHHKHFL